MARRIPPRLSRRPATYIISRGRRVRAVVGLVSSTQPHGLRSVRMVYPVSATCTMFNVCLTTSSQSTSQLEWPAAAQPAETSGQPVQAQGEAGPSQVRDAVRHETGRDPRKQACSGRGGVPGVNRCPSLAAACFKSCGCSGVNTPTDTLHARASPCYD